MFCSHRQHWHRYCQLRLLCSMSRLHCCPAPYNHKHRLGCRLMDYHHMGFPHEIHSFHHILYRGCLPQECQTRDFLPDYLCPDRACYHYLAREFHRRDFHQDYLARDFSPMLCRARDFPRVQECLRCRACHSLLQLKVSFLHLLTVLFHDVS